MHVAYVLQLIAPPAMRKTGELNLTQEKMTQSSDKIAAGVDV